jgi:hypothetical protein
MGFWRLNLLIIAIRLHPINKLQCADTTHPLHVDPFAYKAQVFLCVLRVILCSLCVLYLFGHKEPKNHKGHEVCPVYIHIRGGEGGRLSNYRNNDGMRLKSLTNDVHHNRNYHSFIILYIGFYLLTECHRHPNETCKYDSSKTFCR